eukprot:243206-Prorocentrum_minimum.AAC.1
MPPCPQPPAQSRVDLPQELPGTCHRKSTPTFHRFGRTLAQRFYVDVHVVHPRRIRKLGLENPGHGPKWNTHDVLQEDCIKNQPSK